MSSAGTGNSHDKDAAQYDRQAREHGCHAHEALFGMMYEFVSPGETLLDMGIGTGLGSILFHKMGLHVSGFDSSSGMLAMCEAKGFAAQLVQHDLQDVPFPYPATSFNHVISLSVLHFFADLAPVFEETARIIKPRGVFGFTVEEQKPGQRAEYVIRIDGGPDRPAQEAVVNMHRHGDTHVRYLLAGNGFTPLKSFEFFADRHPTEERNIYFKAYVARKVEFSNTK